MTLIRIPTWEVPRKTRLHRLDFTIVVRNFIKTLVGAGIGASLLPLAGCQSSSGIGKSASATALEKSLNFT